MRFDYEIVRKPAPVEYVMIHLAPVDIRLIARVLVNRYPDLADEKGTTTNTFQRLLKEIEEK